MHTLNDRLPPRNTPATEPEDGVPDRPPFSLRLLLGFVSGLCALLSLLTFAGIEPWEVLVGFLVIGGFSAALVTLIAACQTPSN